ncbi:flagellar basal-body MS-ring/collar protein FliF [Erythrobacter aureus]|uniref:Flagellar M-ring protein n=1 Tax=Erythrobacter aureus TaxID=2182384 RepID=A0A345YJR6_9SPHN|nr:flagellar basal-body MS-ring/collar protein FliF [Erythrobacter aureus]AXK44168.1 flagellar M-ring protein FliF [Erythrobacter aureus]
MGGVALALLAALATVAISSSSSDRMGYLFTDLDPSSAQTITEKLRAQNVPFSITADGTAILAPEDQLAELRMSMAGEQLGGKIGYEVLDEQQPFGVSSSREKLNETRAIEGELARSISTLQSIANARVHIVMPERALFATEARKATASVTVKTRGRISGENVEAIRHLVAAAVPELAPESISIVDQTGALLARAGEIGGMGASQADERKASTEARLRTQIESLLEPILGVGKVRAEVSAEINRDQMREEAQVYDPDTQVIARQVSVESGDQSRENMPGAQGATVAGQLPDGQNVNAEGGDTRESARNETSEDTTYQNSSRHTVTVRTPGQIDRLTVAVMVDGGDAGLPQEQVQRLTRLVENAVGYNADRGDSVIVESMAFAQPAELAPPEGGILSGIPENHLWNIGKLLLIAAVGLFALRMLKPKNEQFDEAGLLAGPAVGPIDVTPSREAEKPQQIEGEEVPAIEDQNFNDSAIEKAEGEGDEKASKLARLGLAISKNPAESASVIRNWINA